MKLTDLIKLLNEELAQHGDLGVHLDGYGWEANSIEYAVSINDILGEHYYVLIHSELATSQGLSQELLGV